MNTIILIPARYQSTRYPGKPLVELKGADGSAKPLIQRSVEAARRVAGVSGVVLTPGPVGAAAAIAVAGIVGAETSVAASRSRIVALIERLLVWPARLP